VTRPARLRGPELLAEQITALCAESERTASKFCLGALDALRWLTEGGPSPLTGLVAEKPVMIRSLVRELAVAEEQTYGRSPVRSNYAQGVLHALMWAQYATSAPPLPLGPQATRAPRRPNLQGAHRITRNMSDREE